jgi:hypothetical protein
MGVGMSHTDRPGRWVYLTGGAAVVNPPLPLLPGQTSEEMGKIWQDEGWGTRNATQLCYRFASIRVHFTLSSAQRIFPLMLFFAPAPGF